MQRLRGAHYFRPCPLVTRILTHHQSHPSGQQQQQQPIISAHGSGRTGELLATSFQRPWRFIAKNQFSLDTCLRNVDPNNKNATSSISICLGKRRKTIGTRQLKAVLEGYSIWQLMHFIQRLLLLLVAEKDERASRTGHSGQWWLWL